MQAKNRQRRVLQTDNTHSYISPTQKKKSLLRHYGNMSQLRNTILDKFEMIAHPKLWNFNTKIKWMLLMYRNNEKGFNND